MERLYAYVGPDWIRTAVKSEPLGTPVRSREELEAWLKNNPDCCSEGATFVVDASGVLRLAPRRSEHVACAGGGPVLAAGEIILSRARRGLSVAYISNQSTGFCPEPDSFASVARVLGSLDIIPPEGYTTVCIFRYCLACRQINLVKDDYFECSCCGALLPTVWNFDQLATSTGSG